MQDLIALHSLVAFALEELIEVREIHISSLSGRDHLDAPSDIPVGKLDFLIAPSIVDPSNAKHVNAIIGLVLDIGVEDCVGRHLFDAKHNLVVVIEDDDEHTSAKLLNKCLQSGISHTATQSFLSLIFIGLTIIGHVEIIMKLVLTSL